MKAYNFQFRKSFNCIFHGEILAKNEKAAQKMLRKFAKTCDADSLGDDYIEDVSCDTQALDDGDDFNVYAESDL